MNAVYDKLMKCYESIKDKIPFEPKVALILGSGLGDLAEEIDVVSMIDYHDIEGFPVSTAPFHKGRFVFGYVGDVPTVIMQGRVHYYEGYCMSDVVLPTRLMGMMGAKILLLTNASGGIQSGMHVGDLMLIRDQISDFVPSPLIGPNPEELGKRFPDMSHIYKEELCEIILRCAENMGITLKQGVYIQLTGPNYESPAEIRMCRAIGADAVGMSTACEAIAANHMGMRVCGISCISNLAAGISDHPLSQEEVETAANAVAPVFKKLVTDSIIEMVKTV